MEQNRREFIRVISLLSLSLGMNPIKVFSQNFNNTNIDLPEFREEFRKTIEEFNYTTKILNRKPTLLSEDYNKLYKISAKTSDSKFQSLSKQKQIQTISRLERKIDRTKVTKENIRTTLIENSIPDWVNALNAANFGFSLTSTIFSGTACLASLMAVPYGAGVPAVATTCPVFLLNAGFTTFAGSQLVGNQKRATKNLQYSTNNLINIVKKNPLNKFLNDDNYSLNIGDINLSNDSDQFTLPITANSNTESDFQQFLKDNLSKGELILNEENLRTFLDEYVEKVGQLQNELLDEYIERTNKAKLEEKSFKEKIAFYKSLGQLTSFFFGSIFPKKEAEILSILSNVGFEYMATGMALGPYGWGAVGIQIATVLLGSKDKTGEFQEYVLKALEQINLQLITINKKLDDMYYNQIDILVELHEITSKIDSLASNVINGLGKITGQLNNLSISINQIERNNYFKQIQTNNLNLKDKLIDNSSTISDDDIFLEIRSLRNNFITHLNREHFTSHINKNLDGNLLKEKIYDSFNYLTKVSLYDKIGLISALFEYKTNKPIVKSSIEIYHPIESYIACQNITSWLALSSLSKKLSLQLVKDIEIKLTNSISSLNQFGDLNIVETKASQYRVFHHKMINRLYKNLEDKETKFFANSSSNWLKTVKLTPESYSLTQNPWNRKNSNYLDDMTDVSFFDVLRDFGFIKRIKVIQNNGLDLGEKASSQRVNKEIGRKILEVEFNNLIINRKNDKGVLRNLKIRYNKWAICTEQSTRQSTYTTNVGGLTMDQVFYYYTPTKYSTNVDFLNKWKSSVKNQYKKMENKDIGNQIIQFESMNFMDFTQHLINEYVNNKKLDFLKNSYMSIFKKNAQLNGIGSSLLVLSLLNKTIYQTIFIHL